MPRFGGDGGDGPGRDVYSSFRLEPGGTRVGLDRSVTDGGLRARQLDGARHGQLFRGFQVRVQHTPGGRALLRHSSADHEHRAGARGGDIEETVLLVGEVRLLGRLVALPIGGLPQQGRLEGGLRLLHNLEPAQRLDAVAPDVDVHPRLESAARVREEDHVGLEPLGLVQVHQPHHIGPARLQRKRLDLARGFGVGREGVGSIGEVTPVFQDLAYAVHRVKQVTGVDAAGSGGGKREVATVLENPVEGGAGREDTSPPVVLTECRQRSSDSADGGIGSSLFSARGPGAAGCRGGVDARHFTAAGIAVRPDDSVCLRIAIRP